MGLECAHTDRATERWGCHQGNAVVLCGNVVRILLIAKGWNMLSLCHELQDRIVSHVRTKKELLALSTTCTLLRQHALRYLLETLQISQFKWDTLQPIVGIHTMLAQTGYSCVKTVSLTRLRIDNEVLELLGQLRQATTLILRMVYTPRYPNVPISPLSFTVIQVYDGGWGDYTLPLLFNVCASVRILHGSGSTTIGSIDIDLTASAAAVSNCNRSILRGAHHPYDKCNLYDLEQRARGEYDLTDLSIFLHNMTITVDPISRRRCPRICFDVD